MLLASRQTLKSLESRNVALQALTIRALTIIGRLIERTTCKEFRYGRHGKFATWLAIRSSHAATAIVSRTRYETSRMFNGFVKRRRQNLTRIAFPHGYTANRFY